MKLYIPTSSLNFSNILSTESISPAAFYQERGFGIPRWTTIDENPGPNVTLLYDKPILFTRPSSDIEDHPMLVEYDRYEDDDIQELGDGVYYTDKTIYLDPWHTRFLFFSENDKTVTLSLAANSAETKMVKLYQKWMLVVVKPTGPCPSRPLPCVELNHGAIVSDQRVNKMKGLLYGYYLGAYLSVDGDDSQQLLQRWNTYKEIERIFSSILSSSDRRPSAAQSERLRELAAAERKASRLYQRLLACVGEKVDEVMEILQSEGLISPTELERNASTLQWGDGTSAMAWVKRKQQESMDSLKHSPLATDKEEIITNGLSLSSVAAISDDEQRSIYVAWVNDVMIKNTYTREVSHQKKELADELTRKAKDVLNDKWERHHVRTFMNDLRKHIAGEAFTQPWDNGLLSSIAACLMKGDDWTALLDYMQKKIMTDYRLAFSFYGILHGFADLTRDFTDNIIAKQDRAYIIEMYKEFAGQLFGRDVEAATASTTASTSVTPETPETPALQEPQDAHAGKNLCQQIIEFINSEDFKYSPVNNKDKKIKDLCSGVSKACEQLGEGATIESLLEKLPEFDLWKRDNKPWQLLRDRFAPGFTISSSKNKRGTKTSSSAEPSLFPFYDMATLNELRDFLREDQIREVTWFFEDLNKEPKERIYYAKVDANNDKWVIDLFCKEKTGSGDTSRIYTALGKKTIDKIRAHFYRKYGIGEDNGTD